MSTPQWQPPRPNGRDPRVPFGAPQQPQQYPPPQLEDYQEPPSSLGRTLLLVIGGLALVGLVLLGLQFFGTPREESGAATPSRPAPSAAEESLGRSGSSIPFDSYGKGTFEVVSHTWGEGTLDVEVRVTLTEGQGTYSAYVFNNETMVNSDVIDAETIHVSAGETKTAKWRFLTNRADSTVVLATSAGTPVTALPVSG
ncbi:hypothetical protein [Arachnia propionica]|uniref:Uncharacterized protein n=1 Tax=Arachnia propionica TaxID=1750 RepID=A0A3P1WXE3_9ACTN|nr:hypothetical protein [Arachnia propionica]RRD50427.1 hypothetical protein EII35_04555 [Arachnia propionica]